VLKKLREILGRQRQPMTSPGPGATVARAEWPELLERALAGRSPYAIANLLEYFARANDEVRPRIAADLAGLIRGVSPREWTGLHANFRSPWIAPEDVDRIAELAPDDAVELLGAASLSAIGHTREAALHALRRLGHPRAVPFVLLRLGDWVPQVRQVAVEALEDFMRVDCVTAFLDNHCLIKHLRKVGKVDLSHVEEAIHKFLRSDYARETLRVELTTGPAATRLFCYQLLRAELGTSPGLVTSAASDTDPSVRRWLSRQVARGEISVPPTTMLALLLDRASSVSTPLLRALSDEQVADYELLLLDLCLSDSRPVRESARFALRRAPFDVPAECRHRLDSPTDLVRPGWIACLGETGNSQDFDRLRPFVQHQRARCRAAAVSALAHIDRQRAVPIVVGHLADSSGLVRRAVAAALADAPRGLWSASAMSFMENGPERAQVLALPLLAIGGWDGVPALLWGVAADSATIRLRAWHAVCEWDRRHATQGWLRPSEVCKTAIEQVWPRVRSREDAPDWAAGAWTRLRGWVARELAGNTP